MIWKKIIVRLRMWYADIRGHHGKKWDYGGFKINKKYIEEIKSNVVKLKIKKPWSEEYKEWKEKQND